MKIFKEEESSWETKVNFVDDNNVFVGYDLSQDCCENADWFFHDEPVMDIDTSGIDIYDMDSSLKNFKDMEKYSFDPYFVVRKLDKELDDGQLIIFRLCRGQDDKYLHIFNAHNGYYGHGFECKGFESLKFKGCL